MSRMKVFKAAFVCGFLLAGLLLTAASSRLAGTSEAAAPAQAPSKEKPQADAARRHPSVPADAQYVGQETCQACHTVQHANFQKTTHSRLDREPSWKGKVTGCEACHGPGSSHVELMAQVPEGQKPTQPSGQLAIRSLKLQNETAKQISDTCLACHSGKEEHNNFRRGEHWRNNVGCTDCHYSHEPLPRAPRPESHTLANAGAQRRIDTGVLRLLRDSEVQLCLKCHTEQRAQFSMPFRHKVLEGFMKCSDCHNPHGGFETRQLRLTTGTDAACNKCHTDKQGPFVFEHSPVRVEGCAICHQPHGTQNPKMLTRSNVFQMCIECHTDAHQLILREGGEGAPAPPSFHNLTQERIRNCTLCHTQIHGSNNHNFFFR